MKIFAAEGVRFLIAGAINTAITYAVYLALLPQLGYPIAYSMAYLTGIVISYLLNALLVFRVALSWRGLLAFPIVYIVQYLMGIAVLFITVEYFALPRSSALLVVIAATMPVTFVLSRVILRRGEANRTSLNGLSVS